MIIEQRLEELNIVLPDPPKPVASYVPGIISHDLVYISAQLPVVDGKLIMTGKLGKDLTVEMGRKTARQAAINCLGVLKSLVGDLDRVEQVIKITGYVQSVDDFYAQPYVVNGASELIVDVFGQKGQHARAAIGAFSLPLNSPCLIDMIVRITI